jgi:hypothetical protein
MAGVALAIFFIVIPSEVLVYFNKRRCRIEENNETKSLISLRGIYV